MQLCVRGIQPDIRAAVEDLRLHRMWMVQNLVSRNTQQTRIKNIIIKLLKSPDGLCWMCLSFFYFPLTYRTSTFLFTSVSFIGSSGELQQGGKMINPPKAFSISTVHWFCHLFHSNLHIPRASISNHVQAEASSFRTEGDRARRKKRRKRRTRHHSGQTSPSDQPQTIVQQILNPGNLLRRLLPSSPLFNSDSQTSWKQSWIKNIFIFRK